MKRRLILAVALGVALFSGVAPAAASHTADHAADEIRAVVAQAERDMDQTVSAFEGQAAGFDDQSQVDSAEDNANQSIETTWGAAKTEIEDLVKLYPGELGATGGSAKQDIQDKRQASRSEIADAANSWTPATATTTTTPTTTTTTTTPATTTTQPPNQGNGVGPPAPGTDNGGGNSGNNSGNNSGGNGGGNSGSNGGGNSGSNGGGNSGSNGGGNSGSIGEGNGGASTPPDATPIEPPASAPSPGDFDNWIIGDPVADPQVDSPLVLATGASGLPVAFGTETMSSAADRNESGATAEIASLLETVLPPALVDLVLSPILILEILIRTIIDGGAAVLGPLSLLAVCAYLIFRYDRSLKRDRFVDGATPA